MKIWNVFLSVAIASETKEEAGEIALEILTSSGAIEGTPGVEDVVEIGSEVGGGE